MSEARVWAPPLLWGPWADVWTRFGVVGPDKRNHRSTINIDFRSLSQAPSAFAIEIDDGERVYRREGPGSYRLVLLGNTALSVRVRCKSHSLGQNIEVTAG